MSCTICYQPTCQTPNACYEARLSLGFDGKKSMIIGSLDGVPIVPLSIANAVKANETNTVIKYDTKSRSLVLENESYKSGTGVASTVPVSQFLSGSSISDLDAVGTYAMGGLASIIRVDERLSLDFSVPEPVQVNELSQGFIAYVPQPASGSHYKIIKPAPGGLTDSMLVGHPDGSIEFAVPITSPLLVPVNTLTSNGVFTGNPATVTGTYGYQTMGTTQVVTNSSKSQVEVTLRFRYSMQSSGTRNGVYCRLINGGSDYQQNFIEGINNIKQEGYPGGMGQFTCLLSPNQKCQFEFGGWENATTSMTVVIGSHNESGGSATNTAVPPTITIRRQS